MMKCFTIQKNNYLKCDIVGFSHQPYTGYNKPDNPDFINTLKNMFNNIPQYALCEAMCEVTNIVMQDIPHILQKMCWEDCTVVCVPRAKSHKDYSKDQLMFIEGVSDAAKALKGVCDGTDAIIRTVDTRTTHMPQTVKYPNIGPTPYPGITAETCQIDVKKIKNQNIILVDDIYTKTVNIDEDCLQALLDNGAKQVVFYSIGFTEVKRK